MRTRNLTVFTNPEEMFGRFTKDMERLFDVFRLAAPIAGTPATKAAEWIPDVDIVEKDGILAIRADLPGMTRKDVTVEVTDNTLTIKGERKTDVEEKKDGVYRQERTYGSFFRAFPLPETIKPEDVKATFTNGVLEATVPVPTAKAISPRRIEVIEPASEKAKTAA